MTHSYPVVTQGSGAPETPQKFEAEVAQHQARLAAESRQDWYFTFGCGNTHPITGEDLMGSYVVINGTYMQAREAMLAAFGNAWCDQYVDAERAGVDEFSLRRIELPKPAVDPHDGPLPHVAPPYCGACSPYGGSDPVTPAEERTGISDIQHAALDDVVWLRQNFGGRGFTERLDRIEAALRGAA